MPYDYYVSTGFALAVLAVIVPLARSALSRSKLPPGPNPIPILGNLSFPRDYRPWFEKWAKEYPDVMTIKMMGIPIIWVNSRQGAAEVLEARAQATSGRPSMLMADELCDFGRDTSRTNDLELHKVYRRLYTKILSPTAAKKFWPTQEKQMRQAALEMLERPAKYMESIRRAVADIVFEIAYGIEIKKNNDAMVERADKALRIVEKIVVPGAFLVDVLPFLKHLPQWFPGAGFQKTAAEWKAHLRETRDVPFEATKRSMALGKARPCLAVTMLEENLEAGREVNSDTLIKWICSSVYLGGADTSVAAIQSFLACMILNPSVQQKAHEELDRVVGRDRPPAMADRDLLPYCNAIVEEVNRYQPVTVVAMAHSLLNDELYKGYVLPKGALVVPNVWAMTRDDKIFPRPHEFMPERYLTEDGKMLEELPGRQIHLLFGFGRRICAGWQLANANLFSAYVAILWSTRLSAPDGTKIGWLKHLAINRPHDFELIAKPRFPEVEEVLRNSLSSD